MKKILVTLISLLTAFPLMAAETLNGAGASFPFPVYSGWAYSYEKETGVKVNYQSIGSGGGIKQITAGPVDFGASDDPLTQEDLDKNSLLQFPAITGGIVVIVNIKGLNKQKITLQGSILADIFMGKRHKPACRKNHSYSQVRQLWHNSSIYKIFIRMF